MSEPIWYLLFGGSSCDGRGTPEYEGRTTDVKVALTHLKNVHKSPYNLGNVTAVTDRIHRQLSMDELQRIAASGGSL